jgi:hypothetical protein
MFQFFFKYIILYTIKYISINMKKLLYFLLSKLGDII